MAAYAAGTDVSISRSITELEKMLAQHGATGFGYGRDDTIGVTRVLFRLADRMVRFEVYKPQWSDFTRTPTGLSRSRVQAQKFADEEEKRRWRALVLVIKALLVGVADGVITLSDAFLAYTVLPSGQTIGDWSGPQLDTIYATATMPALLPGGPSRFAIES